MIRAITISSTTTLTSASKVTDDIIKPVLAGALGGILFAMTVGFVIFIVWKLRNRRKSLASSSSSSTPTHEHAVAPAMYNIPVSERNAYSLSSFTVNYHVYEELP